jgi:hypothetical protein
MARYELTRPITKDGNTATYWDYLKEMQCGRVYDRADANRLGHYMTFQALCEAGLTEYRRGYGWELTQDGEDYIQYYDEQPTPRMNFWEYKITQNDKLLKEMEVAQTPLQEMHAAVSMPGGLYSITVTSPDGDSTTINVTSNVAQAITTLVEA